MYVELKNVSKNFGACKASDDVSFAVEKGKLVGLLGPSGSGKTTVLRIIAGLERPDSGDIFIDGVRMNDIAASKRGIGFVFQNYALFRYMSVFDNIAFGLEVQKKDRKYIKERVAELIELIGLKGLERRRPHQLSGGQKQRVAFARALAPNPHLLLLDEPFAAIDAKVRKELRAWLRETIGRVGITSIFVTHDQDEAVEVADEIIITNEGHVEQMGSPAEIYKNPATPFAARFIGESTILDNYPALRGFHDTDGLDKAIIRPEFISVFKAGEGLYPNASEEAVVEDILFRGNLLEVRLLVKGMRIAANRSLEDEELHVNERVSVLVRRLFLYGRDTVRLVENDMFKTENSVFI